jgi:hypothetical protein
MTVGQTENYQFDYMAIPDEFHDNWTAKLSGDQYKIMVYLLGRLIVSKSPLSFTINVLSKGTGIGVQKIEAEIQKLMLLELIDFNLSEFGLVVTDRDRPFQIDTRFRAGKI